MSVPEIRPSHEVLADGVGALATPIEFTLKVVAFVSMPFSRDGVKQVDGGTESVMVFIALMMERVLCGR